MVTCPALLGLWIKAGPEELHLAAITPGAAGGAAAVPFLEAALGESSIALPCTTAVPLEA